MYCVIVLLNPKYNYGWVFGIPSRKTSQSIGICNAFSISASKYVYCFRNSKKNITNNDAPLTLTLSRPAAVPVLQRERGAGADEPEQPGELPG